MFLKNKAKPAVASKNASLSVISQDMHMLGNILHEDGRIDFDGTLDGNVRCKSLSLRKNAIIQGEITVETLHVYGRVNGVIKAKNVYLYSGCHVEGIIMHEQLSIEDGAFVDGKFKRTDKASSERLVFDPNSESEEKPVKMLENIRLIR